MENLEKLFGSAARVKILKLFLLNTNEILEKSEVQRRTKISSSSATYELNLLEKIDLLKQRSFFKEKATRNGKIRKYRQKGYVVDSTNKLFLPLQNLLVKNSPMTSNEVVKKLSRYGKIKLIIITGIFIQDPDSRVDLLIVGDEIKEGQMSKAISIMESEIGKQIRYSIFRTDDFKYRLGIYDKLVRDILDYPHEVIYDKIGI